MKIIDVHAHILPPSFFKMAKDGTIPGAILEYEDDRPVQMGFGGKFLNPITPLYYDSKVQLAFMDEHGIDAQVLSVSAQLLLYELDQEKSAAICRRFNDDLITLARESGGRFLPMGTLPMAYPEKAVEELCYLRGQGVRAVMTGTTVCERNLSEKEFRPIFSKAEELGILVLLHPLIQSAGPLLAKYHLSNTVANPFQTVQAAANLLFCGIFDELPRLQILLVHGGGYLPFQLGRLAHGYKVRLEARTDCRRSPEEYVAKNIWFDSLCHSEGPLKFLLDTFGASRVMYGTDYPYDMAQYDSLDQMRHAGFSPEEIALTASGNILALLGEYSRLT